MKEKCLLSRIIQKHDIEANWNKALNFIPMRGELIVYDIDANYEYERLKIGDGTSTVNELPFIGAQPNWEALEGEAGYIENRTHYVEYLDDVTATGPFSYTEVANAEDDFKYKATIIDFTLTKEPDIASIKRYNGTEYIDFSFGDNIAISTTTASIRLKTAYNGSRYGVELFATNTYIFNIALQFYNFGCVNKLKDYFIPKNFIRKKDLINSDWDQGDSSKQSYIKNRTHYKNYIPCGYTYNGSQEWFTGSGFAFSNYKSIGTFQLNGAWDKNSTPKYYDISIDGSGFKEFQKTGNNVCTYNLNGKNVFIFLRFDYFGSGLCAVYLHAQETFDCSSIDLKFYNDFKTIEQSYIPDTIARVSDIDTKIIANAEPIIYKQNEEPTNASNGALWIDLDAEGGSGGSSMPDVSGAQEGAFLRVVNGVAAWSTVPNAEEATF